MITEQEWQQIVSEGGPSQAEELAHEVNEVEMFEALVLKPVMKYKWPDSFQHSNTDAKLLFWLNGAIKREKDEYDSEALVALRTRLIDLLKL